MLCTVNVFDEHGYALTSKNTFWACSSGVERLLSILFTSLHEVAGSIPSSSTDRSPRSSMSFCRSASFPSTWSASSTRCYPSCFIPTPSFVVVLPSQVLRSAAAGPGGSRHQGCLPRLRQFSRTRFDVPGMLWRPTAASTVVST